MARFRLWRLTRRWKRDRALGLQFQRQSAEVLADAEATLALWDSCHYWPGEQA